MISKSLLKEMVSRIAACSQPERIILFGSYAQGDATEENDLDLLVIVKKSDLPRHQRARAIRKELWGLTDIPKDILVYTKAEAEAWKHVKAAFITTALNTGKILYEHKKGISKELD